MKEAESVVSVSSRNAKSMESSGLARVTLFMFKQLIKALAV